MNSFGADLQTLGIGLLIARVIIGLVMAAHSTQKLFGWYWRIRAQCDRRSATSANPQRKPPLEYFPMSSWVTMSMK